MLRLMPILRTRRTLPIWGIIVLVLLASGCKRFEAWRGEGFTGADAEWGKKYRPTGPKGERYFFDEKASQIERSLGL